jgi:hypothetical protein
MWPGLGVTGWVCFLQSGELLYPDGHSSLRPLHFLQ